MSTTFVIVGEPAPQGSKTGFPKKGGGVVLVEGGSKTGREKHRAWRQAVAADTLIYLRTEGERPPPKVPLSVSLYFRLRKPKSTAKRAVYVSVKPDLDKLIRSTLDGLSDGGLIDHDQRVANVSATKVYAENGEPTGCIVSVSVLE